MIRRNHAVMSKMTKVTTKLIKCMEVPFEVRVDFRLNQSVVHENASAISMQRSNAALMSPRR